MQKQYPGVSGKCFKTNKIQYSSEEQAAQEAKTVRKAIGARLKPYLCPHCGFHHLGHDRPPEFRKQR